MRLELLLAVAAAVPTLAAPVSVRLAGGAKAEAKLRRFVEQDARLKARLGDAARREEAFVAASREPGLRDSVSDLSGGDLLLRLEQSSGEKRKRILETLPGMEPLSSPACRTIADCFAPDLSIEVPDAQRLPDSLRRMVRPWMVLQQARGSEVELSATEGPGDAALTLRLKDLDAQPIILNVAPRPLGGFTVWFDRPFVLAALYGREREAALHAIP